MTTTSKNLRPASTRVRKPKKARARMAKPIAPSNSEPLGPTPKGVSKKHQLAALVVRDEGATLDQIIAATGWLPHTTRAALTGLKKKGYVISSDKVDGVRTYRAVAPE